MCLGCDLLKQIPDPITAGEFGSALSVLCAGMLSQLSLEERRHFYAGLMSATEELISTHSSTPKH